MKLRRDRYLRHRKKEEKPKVVLKRASFAEGTCRRCGRAPPSEAGKKFCSECLKRITVGGAVIWAMSHHSTSDREYKEWLGEK